MKLLFCQLLIIAGLLSRSSDSGVDSRRRQECVVQGLSNFFFYTDGKTVDSQSKYDKFDYLKKDNISFPLMHADKWQQ
jgi:hypothetical protein